jgi:O-acetyl-ADP-ribose deacetylase
VNVLVRIGELAHATAEGVVRPISADGDAITAAGRRLEVESGESMASRLRGMGDLPVGGALVTPSGGLAAPFIIHAVLQSADEPVSAGSVQRALVNVLRRAKDFGIESLAFPPMGTGAGNLEAEDAAQILVEVLRDHLRDGEAPSTFEIVVESSYEEELFTRYVSATDPAGDIL